MKTLLAPVDFSDATDAVVTEAASLARAFGDRVVLLTVIQPPIITSEYAPMMENLAEITAASEKAAAKKTRRPRAAIPDGHDSGGEHANERRAGYAHRRTSGETFGRLHRDGFAQATVRRATR